MRLKRFRSELPTGITQPMLRANYYAAKTAKGIKKPKSFQQFVRDSSNTQKIILTHAKWPETPQGTEFWDAVHKAVVDAMNNPTK